VCATSGDCVCCKWYKWAVPRLRQLVDRLSLQRPRFSSIPVHEGFVVDHIVLGQVFLRVLLLFSLVRAAYSVIRISQMLCNLNS